MASLQELAARAKLLPTFSYLELSKFQPVSCFAAEWINTSLFYDGMPLTPTALNRGSKNYFHLKATLLVNLQDLQKPSLKEGKLPRKIKFAKAKFKARKV
ncbi:hypothetical protein ACFE04_004149 [Oxalis oulophora]